MCLRRASDPATENGEEGGAIECIEFASAGDNWPGPRWRDLPRTEERCLVPKSARGKGVALTSPPLRAALLAPPWDGVCEECAGVAYTLEEGTFPPNSEEAP